MNLAGFRQFHENPALVAFVQTGTGRWAVWVSACALLSWLQVSYLVMAALGLVMVLPQQRRLLLALAAVGVLAERFLEEPGMQWPMLVGGVAAGVIGLFMAYLLVLRFAKWPAVTRQFPVITVHLAIWLGLALSTVPWLGALALLPFLAWRLSYMVKLASQGKAADSRFRDHLFYLLPVWGGTQTPYGKGLDFLSRHEALTTEAFGRAQLAGIKLLVLALLWFFLLDLMEVLVFGGRVDYLSAWPAPWSMSLSHMSEVLRTGHHPAWYQGWATVYLELIRATLALAAVGHVIVGCLRLLGFNVFRNTYKPLLSESILEFWNRYYYYFKELLVDFFFYPTYLGLRSLGPKTRMFAAVFAAAFLGNMYHHVLAKPQTVLHLDPAEFLAAWGPRLVYCALLALGIWISMLRQQKLRLEGKSVTAATRLRRIAGVWTFYGLIHIWNAGPENVRVDDCLAFFLSLFTF